MLRPVVNAEAGDGGDVDKFELFKTWFGRSCDHYHDWKQEARTCYDFRDGRQWTEEDQAKLKLEQRPIVTFNRTASVLDSVAGLEIANRMEVRFIPRQVGSTAVNQLLTEAGKWCRDSCYAEDEESDAFMDLITCGEGVTESRVSYDEDPDGKFVLERCDPLEFCHDASSRARNHTDDRHCFRARAVDSKAAQELAKSIGITTDVTQLDAVWARDVLTAVSSPHDATEAPYYRNDQSPNTDKTAGMITMVEVQWWELTKAWRVADPMSGKIVTLSADDYKTLQERAKVLGIPVIAAPKNVKKYYRALLGDKILKVWDGPEDGGFTWKFMTGKRDRNKGVWYGLVRAMVDPQKWANKWLAQVMHIINSNAKGGVLAEADAFENPQQAEETYASPASITIVKEGGLDKIAPKPQTQFPAGIDHLMQFAISSIRDVSGVNVEMLGMAARDQPGILEHQRKQAGLTILANLFDSLRQYRKEAGKLMLYYITHFLADGRLIKIGGQDEAQYVPLVHDPDTTEYDVVVDDTPTSPNTKEQAWAAIVQMMPFVSRMNPPPQVIIELLKYSPLPIDLIVALKQMAAQQASQPPQDPKMMEAQAKMQAVQTESQTKVQVAQAEYQTELARAQVEQAKAQGHMAAAQGEAARAAADVRQTQANAFKTTAQGIDFLSDAQMKQHGASFDALQMLLDALQSQHERGQDQGQQSFDNALALQEHQSNQGQAAADLAQTNAQTDAIQNPPDQGSQTVQ